MGLSKSRFSKPDLSVWLQPRSNSSTNTLSRMWPSRTSPSRTTWLASPRTRSSCPTPRPLGQEALQEGSVPNHRAHHQRPHDARTNNGKKILAVRIMKHCCDIIHLTTGENPIQVIVDAVVNSGAREDSCRIGSAGVVRRQAH